VNRGVNRAQGIAAAMALALPLCLGSCIPRVDDARSPRPAVTPAPRPATPAPATVAPAPGPASGNPATGAVSPGTWTYVRQPGGSIARFGVTGNAAAPALAWVACTSASRTVSIGRTNISGASSMMRIRTSFGTLEWPATAATGQQAGLAAERAASDKGLDWISYSRGQFTIDLPGQAPLALPTWAEPARVIQDCRR
jgi:hypothetical protein